MSWTNPVLILYLHSTATHQGYTSLGKTTDTRPNPALELPLALDHVAPAYIAEALAVQGRYLPAYMLHDYSLERAGRC